MQMKNLARLETIAKGMPQSTDVSPPPGVFVQIILHAGLLSNCGFAHLFIPLFARSKHGYRGYHANGCPSC